jgi:hypothetical protein
MCGLSYVTDSGTWYIVHKNYRYVAHSTFDVLLYGVLYSCNIMDMWLAVH